MSRRLSSLLGDEEWKKCLEMLRPPPEAPREFPGIRAYVKSAGADDRNTLSDGSDMVVVRTAQGTHAGSQAHADSAQAGPRAPIATSEDGAAMEWLQEFREAQDDDLKPHILEDSSKLFSYTQVSIKGARHEQQDTIFR